MSKAVPHPDVSQINLSALYDALSDPIRRRIVRMLGDGGELNCALFYTLGSKTRLSYHLARMREAGLTRTRVAGRRHFIRLRTEDLERLFPGWLDAVVASARIEATTPDAQLDAGVAAAEHGLELG